ncbi:collagen alpha-1(XII) chain-like [Babylonia areolata]|uniref:collagen alpha-1(XII) chain-like n=1 Tax=Babylonia areolata TaxID=304850 RepID=UPI003FD4E8B7
MVEAVMAELHDACIYPEDQLLLRRIAFVETRDGTDLATYTTPGYDGGIWKVDRSMFQRTQTESARLSHQYALIRSKLGIDWSTVTWADMRKPLYSALAAAMLLTLEGAPANVPVNVDMQADYWLKRYRSGPTTQTVQSFVVPANALQKTCARTENMDLAFLVDTSSSVGPTEWAALKQFVGDTVISLSLHNGLGPDKDRVAMVTFSDQALVSFGFHEGVDLKTTLGRISSSPLIPGGTNFSAVLTTAYSQVFSKARPEAVKVAVLVSDGRDSDRVGMVMALMPLKLSDVTVFTVGVGGRAGDEELKQMASAPTCSHAFHVDSHQDLHSLQMAVERISCRVPVVLSPGQYTYPCGFNVLAQLTGGSLGTSITVSTDFGTVDVYGSYTTQLPSDNVHDLKETATAAAPSVIYARDPRPLTFSLQSEKSHALLCNGNFTVRVDKQAAKHCNKREPDLIFLLDSSLANTDADWTGMLNFVEAFSKQFDVSSTGAHVALVSFADKPTSHFRLGQFGSNGDLLQALRAIPRPQRPSGNAQSDLPGALEFVHSQILGSARRNASKTLVVVTPGILKDPPKTVIQTSPLHSAGVRVIVAAVGNRFDDVTFNVMASGPQHVQKAADVAALTSHVGDIVKEACGEVNIRCVENGISRECHIEDVISSEYGNLLGPGQNVGFNPCAMQIAAGSGSTGSGGVHLQRFPHPTEGDKFLLCDSSGQAYVVLCPLGQLYRPLLHECRASAAGGSGSTTSGHMPVTTATHAQTTHRVVVAGVTTTRPLPHFTTHPQQQTTQGPATTSSSSSSSSSGPQGHFSNPCTPDMIIQGLLFHAYPSDPAKYYHCGAMPFTGQLETCPSGKVWNQAITQCVFTGVIVDPVTNQRDPNIPNPCVGGADYFPWYKDPTSFIQCNGYHEAYLMHCPTGEVWKVGEKSCGFP